MDPDDFTTPPDHGGAQGRGMDATKLGAMTAEVMEALDQAAAIELEAGREPPELGVVLVSVEILWPPRDRSNPEDHGATQVVYRASDRRVWVQRGLLAEIDREIERTKRLRDQREGEPE